MLMPGTDGVLMLIVGMNKRDKSGATQKRSQKLRREALNCVDIAVREQQSDFAAILIDEALKLSKRARELDAPSLLGREKPLLAKEMPRAG